ncbi:peptidyl-prolyl cis-trans isomerase SurA [Rosistilla carotiformis]|uniref:Peptidyl-prolyl cis-trans isomerase SurA n=1 Tax=Rosistilla carotiformis TaxID=2528017 RepID=A0A518JR07_9BACT|nr:peptidylprolyl isomerase [Rosistilla carotiformis]QDV67973.1 peptidyl-prolyl cis-trans isomerase SurA [Rosistilla carotiformis]
MIHRRSRWLPILLACLWTLPASGQSQSEADAIAWIGEAPVLSSEIDLLIHRRGLTATDLEANPSLRSAIAHVLVRRHLALAALRDQSGKAGAAIIDQAIQAWQQQVLATGTTLEQAAAQQHTDVAALQSEVAWLSLWNDLLRVRLNDANLQRFFETRSYLYNGTQVDISQIFISDPEQLETLEKIADRIRSDAISFADAAAEHSQAGSAADDGHIGWIGADGDLPAVVAEAALAAEPSTLLPIIRSGLGLHLVYVHAKRTTGQRFADLTDQRRLRRDAADFLFEHLVARGQTLRDVRWRDDRLQRRPGR